jgi:hypothetical protein
MLESSENTLEQDRRRLEYELLEQKDIVRQLYAVIVRGMVVLKQLIRVFALAACWFWLGKRETYFLAGFITVIALVQLVIDKTRQTVNPKLKLSEWDIL